MEIVNKGRRILLSGKSVMKYKRERLSDGRGELQWNKYGCYIETNLNQFVLKIENPFIYDREYVDWDRNISNELRYDWYIKPSIIKNKDYRYIEYIPNKNHPDKKLDFETAYRVAISFAKRQKELINIFIYDEYCYILDEKFLSKAKRRVFKDIAPSVLRNKYTFGIKKRVRQGAIKSYAMQNRIIKRIRTKDIK